MESLDSIDIPLEPRRAECFIPLTPSQLSLWNESEKEGGGSDYRIPRASVRVSGPLKLSFLMKAIEAVALRHEPLRTTIVTVDGVPGQHINAGWQHELELADISNLSELDQESEARRIAAEFKTKKVGLSVGPLFDAKLVRLSRREHILLLSIDHIVSDAVSCDVLSADLWALYNAAVRGLPVLLPALSLQFADYAVWHERVQCAYAKRHGPYWIARLAGAPELNIPTDRASLASSNPSMVLLELPLGQVVSERLNIAARNARTFVSLLVLTMCVVVIARWSDQRDIVLSCASHGRHIHAALQRMIGVLACGVYLRVEVESGDSLLDVLAKINLEFASAHKNHNLGSISGFAPKIGRRMLFNWLPPAPPREKGGQLREARDQVHTEPYHIRPRERVVESLPDLILGGFSDALNGTVVYIQYRDDVFAPTTIARVADNLVALTEAFIREPRSCVYSIPLL